MNRKSIIRPNLYRKGEFLSRANMAVMQGDSLHTYYYGLAPFFLLFYFLVHGTEYFPAFCLLAHLQNLRIVGSVNSFSTVLYSSANVKLS